MKRTLLSTTLSIMLVFGLLQTEACKPQDRQIGLQDAQIVINGLEQAAPIFAQQIPAYSADIAGGLAAAQKIEDYLKANDQANALAALSGLIPVFENIVSNDIPRLTPDQQAKVLQVLSLADVALHALVDLLAPAPTNAPKLSVLDVFRGRTGELTVNKYK